MTPVRVFISYAHADDRMRQQLVKHLSLLRREQLIDAWHDRRISPGADWSTEIDSRLEDSDLVLLLISADFLDSDYCVHKELKRALERHDRRLAIVVPILLRPCDWQRAEFAALQALPANGFPVTSRHWRNHDEAFTAIATGLRALAERLRTDSSAESPTASEVPVQGGDLSAVVHEGDSRFATDVGGLYRLFGYRVTPVPTLQHVLFCELRLRGAPTVGLLVLCVELTDRVSASQLTALSVSATTSLDLSSRPPVVVISPNIPPHNLRATCQELGYKPMGYDQLFDELLNLTTVFDAYCASYEQEEIYSSYIPLRVNVRTADGTAESTNAHDAFGHWLQTNEQLLVILGDFGSGKSTLLSRIKYDLASNYRNGVGEAIPLLIPLKHFDAYGPLDAFVESKFQAELDIRLPMSQLLPLMNQKPFVLLLDGFDEIALLSDRTQRQRAFARLVPLLILARKAVVTCRPSYFVDDDEMRDVLESLRGFNATLVKRPPSLAQPVYEHFLASAASWLTNAAPLIGATYEYLVVDLCQFSATDVENYIRAVPDTKGTSPDDILDRIRTTYDLSDLSGRPVLLDLIVKTLPMLPRGEEASPSVIYEAYTGTWLNRDYAKGDVRMLIPAAQKLAYMQELAWHMYKTGASRLRYKDLEPHVRAFFDVTNDDAAHYATDIQSCSFLERNQRGEFRFAHKSFMEYFVASKLFAEFQKSGIAAFGANDLSYEVAFFLGDMMYATRGARKPFITVLREVLNKHGAAPFDQRLLDNALRVFGCSRLECDRLVADGTNWRDVKATSVALSGTLLNQHWKAVVIARSALSNLTIDSLRCSISVIERSSLSHVMFKDVTSNVSSEQPLVLNAVRWSHGRLDGHIEMIGREGEWRDVEIAATRGRLSLGGIGLEHCRIQLIGAVVSVVNGRAGRSTVKGVAVGTTHTADVADAITRNVKRGTAGSVFDGVVFSNCLFMFVNLDAHLLRGCTFNQCFFLGCSLPSFRWLRDWPARNQQHGNMFALLSLNRSNEEGSQRGRKTRTDVTEVDQAGLRLTPELASQLKTERVMIADASRTRGPDWYGFTADAMKAASRYNGPPLERIAVELTADDLF